jgi:hypothetical protein
VPRESDPRPVADVTICFKKIYFQMVISSFKVLLIYSWTMFFFQNYLKLEQSEHIRKKFL